MAGMRKQVLLRHNACRTAIDAEACIGGGGTGPTEMQMKLQHGEIAAAWLGQMCG